MFCFGLLMHFSTGVTQLWWTLCMSRYGCSVCRTIITGRLRIFSSSISRHWYEKGGLLFQSQQRGIYFPHDDVWCYFPILIWGWGWGVAWSSEMKTSFKKAGFPEILDHDFWRLKRVVVTYIQYLLQICFLEKIW